ncbi:hypothetical protein ETD83_21845 [Actinomadura soli]|uniref:Uncharacterized protein n=1 Tax=Actinomadura soli TaxID=2508997 RepID=A0A5C4J9V0_9ACTN|nr:hypothetical protein [Actinomadura soli]TMQ95975.1 hypothetical protein ETD83_21845 [Actinomadura soli]
MTDATDAGARARLIAGLRELADYLETTPAPVPRYGAEVTVHAQGTDAQQCAEVDRAAAVLGSPVSDRLAVSGHYETVRTFGVVSLRVVAITEARMARYRAHISYADNVLPDDDSDVTAQEDVAVRAA